MPNDARRRAPRWWLVLLLALTIAGAYVYVNRGEVRPHLEQWGIVAPPWSSGKKGPNGEWEPKEFVPERSGPSLRQVGRWNCWSVQAIAFFPDGKSLAAGACVTLSGFDWDMSPRSWCVLSVPEMADTGRGGAGGHTLDVSSMGAIAVSTGRSDDTAPGCRIEVLGAAGERPRFYFHMRYSHPGLRFTGDGSRLLATDANGMMEVWSVAEGKKLAGVKLLPKVVYDGTAPISARDLQVDRDGTVAIIGYKAGPPIVVDLKSYSLDNSQWWAGKGGFLGGDLVSLSPDGTLLGSSFHGGPTVFDRANRKTLWVRDWGPRNERGEPDCDNLFALSFSPDGRLLAGCGLNGHVFLFDARDGTLYDQHLEFHDHGLEVRWSPDGKRLAACGDGGVVLYDLILPPGWK